MRKKPKKFTQELKRKAMKLSYARGSIIEISLAIDVSKSDPNCCRQEMNEYGENNFPSRGKPKMRLPFLAHLQRS